MKTMIQKKTSLKVALVVPHIFLHKDILPHVIFSPGVLAIQLAEGLKKHGVEVTLFSTGPVNTSVRNISADMSYFETELTARGDSYLDLLKKHPFIFVSLARQVQAEIIALSYELANKDEFDLVHVYTNEEDIALHFAKLCNKPVVFSHHDPFNFMIRYKSVFPKYRDLNWLSLSIAQRNTMPLDTNWVGNVYHGLSPNQFKFIESNDSNYVAYFGRIIEPKGVHLAIDTIEKYNSTAEKPLKLKIAGKHYADAGKDSYWDNKIFPRIGGDIEYVGFIKDIDAKNEFLGNAKALIIPSTFDEPFGMVMIESLACGTPIIGLSSGAIPEVINDKNGILVQKSLSEEANTDALSRTLAKIDSIDRHACRSDFEERFTLDRMCRDHKEIYQRLVSEG